MKVACSLSPLPCPPVQESHCSLRRYANNAARSPTPCPITTPSTFSWIELLLEGSNDGPRPVSIRLHYRHVNQAEQYRVAEMEAGAGHYRAVISVDYTESPCPLEYFFKLHDGPE